MRSVFEQVIARGNYDLTALLAKIDSYHIEGKISDEDRDALYALARQDAVPQYEVAGEIERLWIEIGELSDRVALIMADDNAAAEPAEEWPEWEQRTGAHDAYRAGDKVTFRGRHYICKMLTTYAPDVYPEAWQLKEEAEE